MRDLPSVEHLKNRLSYDPATGALTWLRPSPLSRHIKVGDEAGWTNTNGYRRVSIDGQAYHVHRVIFKMMTGSDPEYDIDHVDGNRSNNRWANIRPATRSQNNYNRRATATRKGAHILRTAGRFRARITANGREIHLGTFRSPEEANASYAEAAARIAGAFARSE